MRQLFELSWDKKVSKVKVFFFFFSYYELNTEVLPARNYYGHVHHFQTHNCIIHL